MDADEPKDQPEEEYTFSDHEGTEDFAAAPTPQLPPPQRPGGGFRNKRVLFIIGAIVAIFALYKLIDILFTARSPKTTQVATHVERVVPISRETQLPQQPAVAPLPIDQRMANLEQQANTYRETVDSLSKKVDDLQNTLTSLDNRLLDLANAMSSMSTKPSIAVAVPEKKPKVVIREKESVNLNPCCPGEAGAEMATEEKIKIIKAPPTLYVKALVQGRAWLTFGDQVVTVAIGDQLPGGLGIVREIDTHQGTILTSTGAIIGYSPSDS